MKYQGFYDYALDSAGNPDRVFTAQQFCKHLMAIFGKGIVITNATGNDAWKITKIEDLKVKILLGNNSFNFASVNGNPFAVDEEIVLNISQGTDRWDSIMIRADYTSEIRATDIKVVENSIEMIRSEEKYDLRLARIHIVNNVITEILDDRFNIDYCGIAAGLATIDAEKILEEIQTELEKLENQSNVALKNGLLQNNLNAEMLGGSTLKTLLDKIDIALREEKLEYNATALNEKVTLFSSFAEILKNISLAEDSSYNTLADEDVSSLVDNNISTYYYNTGSTKGYTLIACIANGINKIKAKKLKFIVSGSYSSTASYTQYYDFQASNDNSNWDTLATFSYICTEADNVHDFSCDLENENYYKYYRIYAHERTGSYSGKYNIYEFNLEGELKKTILTVADVNYNKIVRLKISDAYNKGNNPIDLSINSENILLYDAVPGAEQTFVVENGIAKPDVDIVYGTVSVSKSASAEVTFGFTPKAVSAFSRKEDADTPCVVSITATGAIFETTSTSEVTYEYIAFR